MIRLSLDALLVLDAIDRRGSFAAAAEALFRVPSAITYSVQKLEQDLGVMLFDRSGHKAKLTSAGRLLLQEGRTLLDSAAMLEQRVKTHATGWEGELRIAISELLPFARVIDLVREFDELGAQTELRLTRENFGGMWDALIDGRADLTIGAPDMPVQGNLYCRELGHAAFGFCVAPSHPLAQAAEPIPAHELRKHRIIVLADSSRTLTPRSASIQEGQTRLTVSSLDDKINMQCAGLGIGFLPLQHVQKPLADGRLLLKAVEDARDPVPLYYAWQTKEPGQAMAWFLQRLRDFDWHLL
ncbi:LysR family transcriptional regulator [Vogesella sp. LYT5W]|uniref:LysR family transcriptional regulator n=1 Tax=Vogesella margarita TaxID=2984199 RepID=A0ABT5IPT6_9NEIS|nr:LysR family transcriptional regulator [Vogesella margarita]MDC7714584.1 LysR family transcriptional regulator [Vogesella margarita]